MIPGDPDALDAAASQLGTAADLLAGSRHGVLRAAGGMEAWRGPAADAARATLNGFGQCPTAGVRVLEQAAPVLREYAAVLRGAQIAVARGQGLVAQGAAMGVAASATESVRAHGASLATEGDDLVRTAHEQVRVAEERAAARIRALAQEAQLVRPGAAPDGNGPVVAPAGARPADPSLALSAGVNGPNAGAGISGPQGEKLVEAKAFADLVRAQAQGSTQVGGSRLSGTVEGNLGVEAAGSMTANQEGLVAKAEASAGLKAKVEGRIDQPVIGAFGRAEGSAGAEAGVNAAFKRHEADVTLGAFAGAKGKVAAGGDVGGIGGGVTAEGWAGVGAEVNFDLGMGSDGSYHIGAGLGAGVLVGGKVGYEFTVDPAKVEQTYHEAADAVDDVGESLERGWNSTRNTISEALG